MRDVAGTAGVHAHRTSLRGLHGHIDFLGTGAISLKEEVSRARASEAAAYAEV